MKPDKYLLVTCVYLIFVLVVGISASLAVRRLPDVGQSREQGQVWFYADHPVSQSFISRHNGLNVITVYMKNVSLRNRESINFDLTYKGQTVRGLDINGYNIGDGDNVRFQFEPLENSQGQEYTFTLSSASSGIHNAVGIGFYEGDNYQDGAALVAGKTGGDVAFSSFYRPTSFVPLLGIVINDLLSRLFYIRLIIYLLLGFLVSTYFSRKIFRHL